MFSSNKFTYDIYKGLHKPSDLICSSLYSYLSTSFLEVGISSIVKYWLQCKKLRN